MKKSNVRYLTTALAATAFLASSPSSSALGIGEMHLQSALNQNLQAEISLILSEGEKTNDLQIGLASNSKFDEAGIPWTVFLSKIKFTTTTANGKTAIKLSSTEVLKEPFLDFLLEIKSSKGTLYREFTVLVDPPSAYQSTQLLPESTPKKSDLAQRFISAPTPYSSSDERTYGPVRENETLWSIAAQFNEQNNISVNRMLAAIYITNPDAFYTNESHALIAGKMLKIPAEFSNVKPKKSKAKSSHIQTVKHTQKAAVITANKAPIESDATKQKVVELEKQVSVMQKTIVEKDAEMVALKTPKVTENPAVILPVVSSPATPEITAPTSPITIPTTVPEETVAVLPQPLPIETPKVAPQPAPIVVPNVPSTTPTTSENYFGIPTDMYYYVVGGAGSLLLGVLGWLQIRTRNKAKNANSEILPETPESDVNETMNDNNEQKATNSLDKMFDDEFDSYPTDFEELSFGLNDFTNNTAAAADKQSDDDILYKADVYCSYGNHELAQKLLHDEFIKQPDAHNYALRLLKLYVTEKNKIEFKNFVFELAELGKKDLPEFWTQVSNLASDFYPEALVFNSPAISDASIDKMFSMDSVDFDMMNFDNPDDKEIIFGESTTTEDFLNSELLETEQKELTFDLDFSGFSIDEVTEPEALTFEIPTEKSAEMDLDFSHFSIDEAAEPEALAFEIPTEKSAEMDLDFSHFSIDKAAEPEALAFEIPTEKSAEMDLDFSHFSIDKAAEPEALVFEIPTEKSAEMDLDFSEFTKSLETKAVEIPETKEFKPINNSLNFEKISHLEEEKVSPTYFNLTAVHNSEEKKLDYSEMSDSEFAESLAAEILEKCKIKEQLCRQKIAQEVLSKLC